MRADGRDVAVVSGGGQFVEGELGLSYADVGSAWSA